MKLDFSGKHALVTGGSGEIGQAVALALATAGAQVSFTYFSSHERARKTEADLQAVGRYAATYRVNFGDAKSTEVFSQRLTSLDVPVDILVHNAASGVMRGANALTARHVQWAFDVNAKSLLSVVQSLTAETSPTMPRGGRIIVMSSLGAVRAIPQYTAVGASKAALESMARHLALELGPRGYGVNVIAPGLVETQALQHFPNREQLVAVAKQRTPRLRLVTPQDVAGLACFLASDKSTMIHGQTIHLDGGYGIVG